MWTFSINPTTPNQLRMLIFLLLSCHKKYFLESLQHYWIQLCLMHSLSTSWWWQELSLSAPHLFGSGSRCWFWFFILIHLKSFVFTGFSPCINCQFLISTETIAFSKAFSSKYAASWNFMFPGPHWGSASVLLQQGWTGVIDPRRAVI